MSGGSDDCLQLGAAQSRLFDSRRTSLRVRSVELRRIVVTLKPMPFC